MYLIHKIHGTALRLFWRIIAPGHPRGWLDIHPIMENSGETAWLHCHGMERWELPNIEMVDVPIDLLGPAHGILLALTGYMKSEKPIGPNENIGGFFHSDEQIVAHEATARQSPRDEEGHTDLIRFVDVGEPAEAGFPRRLFTAHLIAIGNDYKNPRKSEWYYRRATEIYPGGDDEPPVELDAAAENPNNYFGWQSLGYCLVEQGRYEEGIDAFRRAVAHWPLGGETDAQAVRDAIAEDRLPPADEDVVSEFWCNLDAQSIRAGYLRERSRI
jgi:hypothetical protein